MGFNLKPNLSSSSSSSSSSSFSSSSLVSSSLRMSISLARLGKFMPFSKIFRQLEQETETVIGVLQPGPLGIIEHKFSTAEVREAKVAIEKALANWRRNAILEKKSPIMKDYIDM